MNWLQLISTYDFLLIQQKLKNIHVLELAHRLFFFCFFFFFKVGNGNQKGNHRKVIFFRQSKRQSKYTPSNILNDLKGRSLASIKSEQKSKIYSIVSKSSHGMHKDGSSPFNKVVGVMYEWLMCSREITVSSLLLVRGQEMQYFSFGQVVCSLLRETRHTSIAKALKHVCF